MYAEKSVTKKTKKSKYIHWKGGYKGREKQTSPTKVLLHSGELNRQSINHAVANWLGPTSSEHMLEVTPRERLSNVRGHLVPFPIEQRVSVDFTVEKILPSNIFT